MTTKIFLKHSGRFSGLLDDVGHTVSCWRVIKKKITDSKFCGYCSSINVLKISSVQFSRSVVSDSLRPHESQHARPPCPSPTPGVHSNSRPSSPWCHPAISSRCPLLLLPPIPPSIRVFSNEFLLVDILNLRSHLNIQVEMAGWQLGVWD